MDDGEYEKGHRCIGAPIYDYRGDIIAAISASGDKHVLTDDRIEEAAGYVVKKAKEIFSADSKRDCPSEFVTDSPS